MDGIEIAHGYEEIVDPNEQEEHFLKSFGKVVNQV